MRWGMSGPAALGFWLLCFLQPVQAEMVQAAPARASPGAGTAVLQPLAAGRLHTAASPAMQALAGRVLGLADHGHRPFAIVDKQAALLAVYRADGTLAAVTRALLGRDIGDLLVPGVGERTQTGQLLPGDATTPAGRFVSSPGQNRLGEAVVWVDFSAAFAIHRLRSGAAQPTRARRLASSNPRDKRVSAGCVVVPAAFYLAVVQPILGRSQATVYVMPESPQGAADWQQQWQALALPPADPVPVPLSPAGLSGQSAQSDQVQETPRPAV